MNGSDHKHELDDELLSAYLDGELTDSERALVEARLASDPEAQHLLHQLRSVSQDIQALPLETGPRDFRDQVLQRIVKTPIAREATAASAPTPEVRTTTTPLAFQGRRPWIWASLAVAAGLMIMFLNRGNNDREHLAAVTNADRGRIELHDPMPQRVLDESQDKPAHAAADSTLVAKSETALPPSAAATPTTPMMAPPADTSDLSGQVASSGRRAGESSSVSAGSPVALEPKVPLSDVQSDEAIRSGKIVATAPSPPPAPMPSNRADIAASAPAAAPATMPASPTVGNLATGGERGPAGMARPAAAPGQFADRPLPADPAGPVVGGGGGLAGAAAVNQPLERDEKLAPTLVVHVVAKKYALDNKAFEDLLAKNRITFEPESNRLAFEESRRAGGTVYRSSKMAEADRFVGQAAKPTGGAQEVEFLEVEAPRQSIESCLTELQQDSANYAGVAIDKVSVGPENTDKSASADKKLVTDLSRFNRGNVSQAQKDVVPEKFYAFGGGIDRTDAISVDGAKAKSDKSENNGRPLQQAEQLKEAKQLGAIQDGAEKESLGRARRLTPVELQQRGMERLSTSGVTRGQEPDLAKRSKTRSELVQSEKKDAEEMRVLFVISPEPPTATSAPAEKPSK